jgi:hypothetical protein
MPKDVAGDKKMAQSAAGLMAPTPQQFDPLLVPGVIGAELARHAAAVDGVLQMFKRTKAITRGQMGTLRSASDAVQRIGIYSQQFTRLAGGRLRQSHERLSLDQLMQGVIADNDWRYYDAGLHIEHRLQPVEVIVDPGLLVSLLEVAVDCAARYGQAIGIWLHIKNWPEYGVLTLKARPHVAVPQARPEEAEDPIEWVMLLQIAQAMGVLVTREVHADHTCLTMEFPRTVKQLEGLTAIEVDSGGDSTLMSESKPLAGHRVLLVTNDERLRWEVRDVCHDMRLVLDLAPSTAQAIRYCERDKPDMILVDERLHDEQFDLLRGDLLRYDVNFPCVEIATRPNVMEMASWVGDRMSRVSRQDLRQQLPSMLAMELAKVF